MSNTTNRVISEGLEQILEKEFPILDKGFVRVIDYLGNDNSIVQAARVSYGTGTKKVSEDVALINYLMRNYHCYHKNMEVLTIRGWLRWSECNEYETFIIPTRDNKILFEKLKVVQFDIEEELVCFSNKKLFFSVTQQHKMYFKPTYEDDYDLYPAEIMDRYGSFYSIKNYRQKKDFAKLPEFQLIGFYLSSSYTEDDINCVFPLKNNKRVEYLTNLLKILNIEYSLKMPTKKSFRINIKIPEFIKIYMAIGREEDDRIIRLENLTFEQLSSIFDGLVNSNGTITEKQIKYVSFSAKALRTFETIGSILGYDVKIKREGVKAASFYSDESTKEIKKEHFLKSRYSYKGKVYCTTSTTGLLFVRGNENYSAFVCGNSTPFEMCEIKFHIKCPIFVMRQLIRHRTASINEYSARYSIVDNDYFVPEPETVAYQSKNNKQGRDQIVSDELANKTINTISEIAQNSYKEYNQMLEEGIARELARVCLPLNFYTEFYWKVDLHNFMNFLRLRADPHAQYEIRVYAIQMLEVMKLWVPHAYDAFINHRLNARSLSAKTLELIKKRIAGENITQENSGLGKREWEEVKDLFACE